MNRSRWFLPTTATLGFIFLYAPIISLVVFSFNANRLVTVWSGFSLQSYVSLWEDPQLLPALWLSLQIAAIAATIATVLGTLCAVALVRFRRFRGKTVLQATVSAPLGDAGRHHRARAALAVRRHAVSHRLAGRVAGCSPSSSRMRRSARRM